ncbi:unnamed protein product [Rotaria sp. Silwood2]|nr:unnamed protein product [Rotaria sp. Silwood2]CAF3043601.1 unnamed protein product [Rotaria sp. Silwood2]CAF3896934.1 unnamed protein product [Rotaria sp. Silwood2]CAF4240037.1 unnamed protein product [Rotaria sp. Silwood2]
MHPHHVILFMLVFLLYKNNVVLSSNAYYAIRPFQGIPHYGSIFSYHPHSSAFRFYANFSFEIDDNTTDLYYFEAGPVAVVKNTYSTIYMPIQCGTSFQRLLLLKYDIKKKNYKQSRWLLNNGVFHFLHYDPRRQRLFGLRDVSTFTLIIEEFNLMTLDVIREYTRQDGEKYAFPYAWCSVFDPDENWIVQVRTRFEGGSINAYYIKMDLNLVGKKKDIVTEFYLLPKVYNLCTMTYDIKTKVILATWQHGSIDKDIVMIYMNPYTSKFRNEILLLKTPSGLVVESIKAVFNESNRQVLFMIKQSSAALTGKTSWSIIVDFDTMKIIQKKQATSISAFDSWEFFNT